jgi:hypothetical protein
MINKRKLNVFLCHSSGDKDKVRELYFQLVADGFDAWLDEEKLIPGQEWDLEIRNAVRNADVVIVCLTNNSISKTGYVQKEIKFALDLADEQPEGAIFLIPAKLEECQVPSRLNKWQWVDLYNRKGYEKLKSSLEERAQDIDANVIYYKKKFSSKLLITSIIAFTILGLGALLYFKPLAVLFDPTNILSIKATQTQLESNSDNHQKLPGKIAYISQGDAWFMEIYSDFLIKPHRITNTGDLDSLIFRLSRDGQWLLFTRKSTNQNIEINTLWVVNLDAYPSLPIDLKISNVIHFADFVPNSSQTISYSTAQPRSTAPGWQADNNLVEIKFDANGPIDSPTEIIPPNSGGVYGWWGINYFWSPDGSILAYARPDEVGFVNFETHTFDKLEQVSFDPLQTHSDWTLIPSIAWSPTSDSFFMVSHAPPPTLVSPEESPFFNLSKISIRNETVIWQTGMFAYPSTSELHNNGESSYNIAYLQAIYPEQSATSPYVMVVTESDGSNPRKLFPPGSASGLEPQKPIWAPNLSGEKESDFIAIVYQGNLWLVTQDGKAFKITDDGLINQIDWR